VGVKRKAPSWLKVHYGSLRFYIALVLAAIGLHYIGAVLGSISDVQQVSTTLTDDYKKKQIDLWTEMNKLLIALATVVIGGIGGVVLKSDSHVTLDERQMRRAAAGWIFCALSLYFGYLSYQEASIMLSNGIFDAKSPRLFWPTRGQFWSFLISVLLFGDLAYGSHRRRRQS
jgi:Ni/Fe-hydrogenase subunit HybB-like protein